MQRFLAGAAGVGAAVAIYVLLLIGSAAFQNIHHPPNTGEFEFALSKGMAAYFVALSIGSAAGLFAVFRVNMSAQLRIFLMSMCCVLVGLFALCDLFAVPALLDPRY